MDDLEKRSRRAAGCNRETSRYRRTLGAAGSDGTRHWIYRGTGWKPFGHGPSEVQRFGSGFWQCWTGCGTELERLGVKVVGLSDRSGGIYNPKGLPIKDLVRFKEQYYKLVEFPRVEKIAGKELLELPCDILVPSATEMQITQENAERLKCRILVEGANGPTTLEADKILSGKGVLVIPDILANAGGVIVSYFGGSRTSKISSGRKTRSIRNLRRCCRERFTRSSS